MCWQVCFVCVLACRDAYCAYERWFYGSPSTSYLHYSPTQTIVGLIANEAANVCTSRVLCVCTAFALLIIDVNPISMFQQGKCAVKLTFCFWPLVWDRGVVWEEGRVHWEALALKHLEGVFDWYQAFHLQVQGVSRNEMFCMLWFDWLNKTWAVLHQQWLSAMFKLTHQLCIASAWLQ